ncbi:TPA: OprD family outer membrane porin [Pseudomonas aeruginosa]
MTEEGQELYDAALGLFSDIARFREQVRGLGGRDREALHLGCVDGVIGQHCLPLPLAIRLFRQRAPEVLLKLHTRRPDELEHAVLEERLQLAVGAFHHRLSGLYYQPLFREEQNLYCGSAHPFFARADDEPTLDEICAADYVGRGYMAENHRPHDLRFNQGTDAYTMEAIATLVFSGTYIGYLPTHYAATWVAAGFIEDSKASLTLRNFYINTDNRNGTASPSKQEEWGQGFILNYQSGFTQGTVGFGVDALGLLGVRLDGGGRAGKSGLDRQPGTVFPLESNGEPVHDFASLGLTAKAKVSNTEFRYGTLQPKLPVVTYNDGRLLPVTFEGGQVTSTDLKDFTLVAGQLEHSKGRNSTDNRSLSIAGANGSSASSRDSNKFYYAGGDYKVNKDLTLQYYYGNLDDFYKQHFLGLIHNWQIGPGVLKTDLRAFDSSSDGKNGSRSGRADGYVSSGYYGSGVTKGEVDNRAFSGLFTYTVSGHSIGAGYQILNGDSDFPFLNRGDGEGSTAYLITDVQIGKFQRAGERTWQVRYGYDFATVGVPGLTFNTIYLSGDKIKTARGDQSEWERDISLAYVIPDGTFKGLGFTWKNASFRSGLPAAGSSNNQRDQDENRLIVSYTLPLL